MYTTDNSKELFYKITDSIEKWGCVKVDQLVSSHPQLRPMQSYLKRGLHNFMVAKEEDLCKMWENVSLFIADENGNIDSKVMLDDMLTMFADMDIRQVSLGLFDVEFGKGCVKINLPHSIWSDLLFGNLGEIKITSSDLLELKNLINH